MEERTKVLIEKEWRDAEPVRFPWTGQDTGVEIREMLRDCPGCGTPMEQRGRIWEAFGAVEIRLLGACRRCRKLHESRARLYPKTGDLMEQMEDGTWRRSRMEKELSRSRRAWNETLGAMRFIAGGVAVGVVLSCAGAVPNERTVAGWVLGFVLAVGLSYGMCYWFGRK